MRLTCDDDVSRYGAVGLKPGARSLSERGAKARVGRPSITIEVPASFLHM